MLLVLFLSAVHEQVSDEFDDQEEHRKADALLPAVADPDGVGEEEAADDAERGQNVTLEGLEVLGFGHQTDHHRDIHDVQEDDADLVGLPGDPLNVVYNVNIGATISTYILGGQKAAIRYVLAGVKVGDVATKALTSIKKVNIAVDYNAGEYEVTAKGAVELIERVLNYSVLELYDNYKADKDGLVAEIVGEDKLSTVADLFGQGYRTNETYVTLLDGIKLIDAYKLISGKAKAKDLVGEFTLGSLVTNYLPGKAEGKIASGKLVKAILDTKIKTLDKFNKTKFFNLYGEYLVGDALASFMTLGVDENGAYVYEGTMSKVISKIFNYELNTFKGNLSSAIDTILDDIYVGEVLGYERINDAWYNNASIVLEGSTESFQGLVPVINVNRVLAEMKLKELATGFNFNSLVDGIMLGELFGYASRTNSLGETTWYLYNKEGGAYVVTGPDVNETYAYVLGDKVAVLDQTLSNIAVRDLLEGNGVDVMMDTIYELELGHVLGYTLDGGNWYNGSTLVTGVQAKISHHTINELKSDVHLIIDEWTIGDVISNISPDNHILYALKDTQLDDLSVAISTMKLGTVMGYTHDGTKWTENGVEVTDKFAKILADYTVEQIGSDGFADG